MTHLKVVHESKCIGCELCVMECQRQLKRVGLTGSYIRIMRDIKEGDEFKVSLDPKIEELKANKLVEACPRDVFVETEDDEVET